MSVPFFKGFHQILRLLGTTPETEIFRTAVARAVEEDEGVLVGLSRTHRGEVFERLPVWDRHRLMIRGGWLLQSWPDRVVKLGRQCRLSYSSLLQDLDPPPYWLWKPASEELKTLYTEWRDPNRPKQEQYSYRSLASRKRSFRLAANEKRLDFISENKGECNNLLNLAKTMKKIGLYGSKSDPWTIIKHLPKIIKKADDRNEWWRIAGKPFKVY